eukprot:4795091-Prymnesium_polylepis.1
MLRSGRPTAGLRAAERLADSDGAWRLRARAHVAMGALGGALAALTRVRHATDAAAAEARDIVSLAASMDEAARRGRSFHPRAAARGAMKVDGGEVRVTDGSFAGAPLDLSAGWQSERAEIGYRVWSPRSVGSATGMRAVCLYFHGNGEVAADCARRRPSRAAHRGGHARDGGDAIAHTRARCRPRAASPRRRETWPQRASEDGRERG